METKCIYRGLVEESDNGILSLEVLLSTCTMLRLQSDLALNALFNYSKQQWLNATLLMMWNVYTHETSVPISNHCNGWHNRFNTAVFKHHPDIWMILLMYRRSRRRIEFQHQQDAGRRRTSPFDIVCFVSWHWYSYIFFNVAYHNGLFILFIDIHVNKTLLFSFYFHVLHV